MNEGLSESSTPAMPGLDLGIRYLARGSVDYDVFDLLLWESDVIITLRKCVKKRACCE
jgi:hypothetical protein